MPRRYEIRTGTANEAGVLFKREGLRATAQAEQKGTAMTVRVLRLGTARVAEEGLRIGTVRRPPRGMPTMRYAAENWYDVLSATLRGCARSPLPHESNGMSLGGGWILSETAPK